MSVVVSRGRARRGVERVLPIPAIPAAIWLVLALSVPIIFFVVIGFWRSDLFGLERDWTLDQYRLTIQESLYRTLILRTISLALIVAAVCTPVAYALAYVIRFHLPRVRNVLLVVVVGSLLASYLVRIYAWQVILGPEGAINRGLELLGVIDAPIDALLYGRFSVILTLSTILLPVAVLPIYAALSTLDTDAIRASRDLGGGPVVTFFRVTLPLTWSAASLAFVFVFILAIGDYVTPQLVGGIDGITVGRVIADQFGSTQDYSLASALAVTTIAAALLTIGVLAVLVRVTRSLVRRHPPRLTWLHRGGMKGGRPRAAIRATGRVLWTRVFPAVVLVVLLAPIFLLVLFSFNDSPFSAFPMQGLTLDWYSEALGEEGLRSALVNSVQLALLATSVALLIGIPAGFALARRRFRLRTTFAGGLILPLVIPGMIIGFSILVVFRLLEIDTSLRSAAIGHVTLLLPFVAFIVAAGLQNTDPDIESAARDLGCGPVRALVRVILPLLAPTLIGAAVLCFALSLDEFVITNFTIGPDTTLPTLVWGLLQRRGITPAVNAIATLLLFSTLLLIALSALALRRRGRATAASLHTPLREQPESVP